MLKNVICPSSILPQGIFLAIARGREREGVCSGMNGVWEGEWMSKLCVNVWESKIDERVKEPSPIAVCLARNTVCQACRTYLVSVRCAHLRKWNAATISFQLKNRTWFP